MSSYTFSCHRTHSYINNFDLQESGQSSFQFAHVQGSQKCQGPPKTMIRDSGATKLVE